MPRIASPYIPQLLLVGSTCGLLATVTFATRDARLIDSAEVPVPAIEPAPELMRVSELETVRQAAPPPAPSNQLLFVFRAGGETYAKLSDDEPKHGKRKLITGEDGTVTIAEVAAANLPAKFRGWGDKTFTVDGGCTATVKGFAVVTRLEGDPGYAGLDDEKWTVQSAAKAGTSQLAVPEACEAPLYARDASLAPMGALETLERPDLVEAARSALLANEAAAAAQTEWTRDEQNADSWSEHAEFTSFVRRHPGTGQIFVGLHAGVEHGCGGPDINLWALFRVGEKGELVKVEIKNLDTLHAIERVLDVDNDGKLELLGRDWLGMSLLLTRASGDEISRLQMDFFGCPC